MTRQTRSEYTRALGKFALILLGGLSIGSTTLKSARPAKLILEVINKHHTMGRAIPSIYLRVFSDGSVECHTEKYIGDEIDSVKKKSLTPAEIEALRTVLVDPKLSEIQRHYGLMYLVVDSWMEWDIKVQQGKHTQSFQVLNFAPGAARENGQPYPDSLLKLGCSIARLRFDVYEDADYNSIDCDKAMMMR